MVKMKAGKKKAIAAPAVSLKKPKPKKARPKAKRAPRLTVERLRELAAKYPPPQRWFDEDFDGI